MKRHEALAPLSREHHDGLILAQLLKQGAPAYRGLPTDTAGKLNYARELFDKVLDGHFLQEELMLDMIEGKYDDIDLLARQIRQDHLQLKKMFQSLSYADAALESKMDTLGHELEKHIRTEERILFPAMQEKCLASELEAIGNLIEITGYEKRYPKQG